MPLRIAEVNGWLKAVNKCRECPFMKRYPEKGMVCEHNAIRMTENEFKSLSAEDVIPVWCPLPETAIQKKEIMQLIDILREGRKRQDEIVSSFLGKMRGLHPELIVGEEEPIQPVMFIVQGLEVEGMDRFVTIKPEFPQGPDWTYLRGCDCLVTHTAKSIIRCWVTETPTSSRVKMTLGGEIKVGDWLTLIGPLSAERRSKHA